MKKYTAIPVLLLWAVLTAFAWFGPRQALSETERRPLAQMPDFSVQSLLGGSFMEDFEDYSLDQFPLRDTFREVKSLFHYYALGQKDNNGIYLSAGHAVKQEYPLNEKNVEHALERFQYLYDKYLTDNQIYAALIPDKNYYLAGNDHLSMDYDRLYALVEEKMPWAAQVDLRPLLGPDGYYRTDPHWRQEALPGVAEEIAEAMGVTALQGTPAAVPRPFYGVYYGQAALPMEPDTMYLLENELLEGCTVYDYETGKTGPVYDREKLEGKDPYEVFLSGPKSLLTIENPAGQPGKELIVFRDSFGSALIPLLVQDYEKVTLIDIRYLQSSILDRFVEFKNQDVLFLYSTLVLNNGNTMK